MDATALHLKCQATGSRKCKNAKIFCPMAGNCICDGCPSNVKMYCPTGVLCSAGGATVVNMDKYICKGTGSNMYCPDIDESIETCGTQEECTSLIWGVNHLSMSCKNSTGHYNRPRCPYYYQDRYDNVIYNHVNVTVTQYENAVKPLVDFCKESIPWRQLLQKPNNRAFQIKSWDVGCEKKKDTLDKCKKACNNGCCGSTCASNSCSGGGCCAASKNICIEACKFMFNPTTKNVINVNNVTNVTRIINKTIWFNQTHTTNKTRWFNKTVIENMTRWTNKTRWFNKTRWLNNTINVTRFINKTRWFNKTRLVNKTVTETITRWINNTRNVTRYINRTIFFNKTVLVNKTRYINRTKWFNKTRFVNRTRWVNRTRFVNRTRWINRTRFVNRTKWFNKTNITEKINWVNKSTSQSYVPTNIPKFMNTTSNTTTPARPKTVQDFVIWGCCLVIGFMGGCFFSYAVYKFKSFIDEWFGCCDIHDIMESNTPPPSPKKRPKKIEIVSHPRVNTLRKRSLSNSPTNRKRMEI
tara:strand:+ start:102 stop:1676 length:1575 start_codon:yes stop_codon:yes gene_type:complete